MSTPQASATAPITTEPTLAAVGARPGGQPPIYYESTTTLTASGNVPARPASALGFPVSANPSTFTWPVTAVASNFQTLRGLAPVPPANLATQDGYLVGDVVGFIAVSALTSALTVVNGGTGGGNVSQISPGSVQCATFCQWTGVNWVWIPQWSANGGSGNAGGFWVNGNQNGPVANQSTSASIGVGGAPPTPVAGAFQVRADGGVSSASGHAPIVEANSIIYVTATGSLVLGGSGGQFGASMSGAGGGGAGGVSLGAGDFAPMFVDGHLEVRATLATRLWTAGTCLADAALTSADASSLLDVASVTRGARPWPTMTTAQRSAIVAPAAGLKVYCSDVVIGDFEYNGVGYVPYGFSQSGTGALTAGALVVTNVYLSASSVVTISVGTPAPGAGSLTIRYDVLQASRTSGFGTGSFTISALLAAGTLNNLDTSTNVRWAISGT